LGPKGAYFLNPLEPPHGGNKKRQFPRRPYPLNPKAAELKSATPALRGSQQRGDNPQKRGRIKKGPKKGALPKSVSRGKIIKGPREKIPPGKIREKIPFRPPQYLTLKPGRPNPSQESNPNQAIPRNN